jgi:tRNA A-37 threonylcarbamoyl transferase component Bud32
MRGCPGCGLRYPAGATTCFVDGIALEDIPDPRIGTAVAGRYLLESVIGEGGMATVYRAHHRLVNRPCAVKVMSSRFVADPVIRERFRREAKAAQKLAHPNIIEIFDQGETEDKSLYLVMELLEGHALSAELGQGGLSPSRALPILIQIARALARAHDLEVIHRDLKPENIFIARQADGSQRVVLLDFGIARSMQDARLTEAGKMFGSPAYMAPERITSIDAGPAADLYAVGVITFEMLTGELPFRATNPTGFFIKHMQEPAPRVRSRVSALPENLEQLIAALLAKDPGERPVDAHRLCSDLMDIAGAIGVEIPAEPAMGTESSAPAVFLPPANVDRWRHRVRVFQEMLKGLSRGGADSLAATLEEITSRLEPLAQLRQESVEHQRQLEDVEVRARDGRLRFGHAVDALGVDASRARDESKQAAHEVQQASAGVETARARVLALHAKLLFWEGRSGFAEPYRELGLAYRRVADAVDQWAEARDQERLAQERSSAKKGEVTDLEFQIQELRIALAALQQSLDTEQVNLQTLLSDQGNRADRIEVELLDLAVRFCAPLRARAELKPLFRELE